MCDCVASTYRPPDDVDNRQQHKRMHGLRGIELSRTSIAIHCDVLDLPTGMNSRMRLLDEIPQ